MTALVELPPLSAGWLTGRGAARSSPGRHPAVRATFDLGLRVPTIPTGPGWRCGHPQEETLFLHAAGHCCDYLALACPSANGREARGRTARSRSCTRRRIRWCLAFG